MKLKTKDKLLSTATVLFSKNGFYGTSINDVAAEVSVSKQGLLHHFPSKEKLYAAVRGGIKTVLIPEENAKDLDEIDNKVIKSLNIVLISDAKSILGYSLTKPVTPGVYTESESIKGLKTKISQENLPESTTH